MKLLKPLLSLALSGLLLVALAPGALAASLLYQSLDELATDAEAVVRGRVVASESVVVDGRIVTRIELEIDEVYKGPELSLYVLEVPGGRHGNFITRVPGADTYSTDEEVLVFLHALDATHWISRSLAFSKFRILREGTQVLAERSLDNLLLLAPGAAPLDPARIETRLPLHALEGVIRDANRGVTPGVAP